MEQHWEKIIEAVGEDLQRPGLQDTPKKHRQKPLSF